MAFLKNPKFWSILALVASLACIAAMLATLSSFRSGSGTLSFGEAGQQLRTLVQVGVGVSILALVSLVISRKDKMSLIISSIAALIILIPVVGAIALNPDQINPPAAPAGPPQAATAGMAAPGGAPAGAGRTPPLNDISTDTQDPPLFSAVAPLRPEGSNTLEYPANGPEIQQQLFPDIAPIISELDAGAAFDRAVAVAEKKRWEIVAQDPSTGIIEAVSTTMFFGFKDDVVIRVRPSGSGSIVDIRSHSRVGRGDRGKNAERVRGFIEDF